MNCALATQIDQFLKERTYLKNVTPSTLVWYRVAFKNYRATLADDAPPLPTKASLQEFVVHERQRGVRAVTVAEVSEWEETGEECNSSLQTEKRGKN